MTFPAARELDPITHDAMAPSGAIGPPPTGPCPGMGQVLIEGQIAAHVGCAVICTGALSLGVAHPPPPVPPLILSGAGTVFIHGKPAARWMPAPDLAACGSLLGNPLLAAGRTVFIGGISSVMKAAGNLLAMLQTKMDDIDRWDSGAQATFEKWFGNRDEKARAIVKQRISKMQSLLHRYSDSNFKGAGSKNKADLFAYVYPDDERVVHLGNLWASAPETGTDSQAGTLGHEMSHFDSVGATDDVENSQGVTVYGVELSKQLAIDDPSLALTNADNFEFYLENAP